MNISKIFASFIIIIIIAISSAVFTIIKMQELSDNTQKMYTHPFQVSNAISDIQTSIITIHRDMKDIVLSQNTLEVIKLIELIQKEEDKVLYNFKTIYQYYLGDKKDIDLLFQTFKEWKPIREEVILLVQEKQLEKAIKITQNKGAEHIDELYTQIAFLKQFAFNKAEEFHDLSISNNSMKYVIATFLLTLLISTLIVYFITINLFNIGKINNKQLHLIDQNIYMATLSLDKDILFISNALCFLLGKTKEELLNTKQKFFFCDEEQYSEFMNKIYLGKEHHGEIFLMIDNEKIWFKIEIFPELNSNFQLNSFNIFLHNINDKKKIEKISITDVLTGLFNRNYFELVFDKEIKRAKRDTKSLGMIMFDIDFFKQFNDTYGHQEGDIALKEVSKVLKNRTNRSYDYAFRLGGEEFVIVTYNHDLESLEEFTQSILDEIKALQISHRNSKVSNYLTVSAGTILFEPSHFLTTNEMYKRVDECLYQAKESGRDCLKSLCID